MPTAPMTLTPPAGGESLLFKSLAATEALSQPFEFVVEALSEDPSLDPTGLLGEPASVTIEVAGGGQRHFHGRVCAMSLEGMAGRYTSWRLVLRPWLWLLTRRTDTRIFQDMDLKAILTHVLQPFSVDYRVDVQATLPTYPYKVQYRETDFDFVSRLLEDEGLYYYFEHTASQHVLVIVDHPSAHEPVPGDAQVPFRASLDAMIDVEAVTDWRVGREIQSGQVVLDDHDYRQPATSLRQQASTTRDGASASLELYDHPGGYVAAADGQRYATLRLEEARARYLLASGRGPVRHLATGAKFTLTEHPLASQNAEYLLVSTRIDATYAGYDSGDGDTSFQCRFTAMPSASQFRPPRVTPRPYVQGPQTAVVTGPDGEEIYTDETGCVKVQFFWDRLGQKNAQSSCWIRVSSPWAGKQWGMISLPRIGQEVVVSFLDGDPDRPLVTGRVYNNDQMPPYALPDNATVSTWKSRSSKNGGATDGNELRFEDKKGSEHVLLQAQKDYVHLVKNDSSALIGHDDLRVVKNDQSEDVEGGVKRHVAKDRQESIDGKQELKIGGDHAIDVGGKQSTKAGADLILQAGAGLTLKSGANGDVKIGANLGVDTAANVHIKAGANLVIEAGAMITLKAGSSSIVLGPTLSITGSMVMINSGGAPGAGAGASPKSPADAAAVPAPPDPKDPLSA